MIRSIFVTGIRARLALALVLGAIAFTPLLAPAAAVAQEEAPGVCDLYEGSHPTIQRGSDSEHVLHAQCLLNELYGFALDEDGIFGPRTETAVRETQDALGLVIDGIVGDCTWEALHGYAIPVECFR
jgi:peptidoglycan hydrolase-like protein with peptidoglycan-binding domain